MSSSRGPVQRDPDPDPEPVPLAERYRAALADASVNGDYRLAAELLNGFSRPELLAHVAALSPTEVSYLHLGALGNPAVGPDSQAAELTAPGAVSASTAGPLSSRAQAPPPAGTVPASPVGRLVADMTPDERMAEAFSRARLAPAVVSKISSLVTREALVAAVVAFAVVFVASQFTPVGWAADIALGLTAVFAGTALLTTARHLVNFASARTATTEEELDWAGQEFARAVAEIGVDAVLFLVVRSAGGGPRTGPPPPATGGVVLATENGELVVVAVQTIPATVAAELGVTAGATAMAMVGGRDPRSPRSRPFEPPVRDHGGKLGGDIPETGQDRARAVSSWTLEELEVTADEIEQSLVARQAEMDALGETSIGAQGQRVGAAHRIRIRKESDLLKAIERRLGR